MPITYVSGGKRLAAKLAEISRNLQSGSVRIGFLENATYPNGIPVAMVAAIQEFGAPAAGIPPRPFFRSMIAAHEAEWPEAAERLAVSTGYDTKTILGQIGAGIAGQLRQSIVDTNTPPLAASTIAAKGSSKPLVDTGHMLASIDFAVSDKPLGSGE